LSDSQISAVVPNGSGIVDVRVQSGLNETDPNNPSDNVNNPLFGYGISAASAADQFLYQSSSTGPDQLFVSRLYSDLLGRPADASGLIFWSAQLDRESAGRQQVASALVNSPEFKTDEIRSLYQSILGRAADQGGLQSWLSFLFQGGTAQQVEAQLLGSG